ncbi:T9SS type A sorting domain-containing protein [Fulvivirga maritima]|uniref:glycosyl hydrolase n=1 Tax=Fulvivirga maritima TaxID=2904247 RepID=UPI001F238E68|nr:glycosyl hydrolase [Fulvivirga maritima]UII24554.1 T9SS type A sorting domain-containing protein [Fulvivirga maritima]
MKTLLLSLLIITALFSELNAQKYEAENGTLTGTSVASSRSGYSGSGYVTGFDQEGDQVAIEVSTSAAGLYELSIGYATDDYKENYILVNNENMGSMKFEASPTFLSQFFGKIFLEEGDNTITIRHFWGWTDIDYITITEATPADYSNFTNELVTENATDITKRLYKYLSDMYGEKIISGQQGSDWSNLQYVQDQTGKLPALRGFDFIDYSPSRVEHGLTSNETEEIIAWNNMGGLSTVSWHWNAPKDLIDEPGLEWWRGFYTEATTFDVSIAMNNPNSEEYELIIRDIDVIAEQLKVLQAQNIPILFRPLHEAEGGWFWWGAKGPEPCKWLWHLLFDRVVNHHNINNLIWIWTSTDAPDALDWYPGDDYVDIIGADIYLEAGDYSTNFSMFDNLVSQYEGEKIITLSETGTIPEPDDLESQAARWSWFCTWEGDFIKNGIYNSSAHLVEVYNHDYVITLDELPNISTYEGLTDESITAINLKHTTGFSIYPNPATSYVKVEIDNDEKGLIQLISMKGEVIYNTYTNGALFQLDLSSLPSGMYVLKVIQNESSYSEKLLKK